MRLISVACRTLQGLETARSTAGAWWGALPVSLRLLITSIEQVLPSRHLILGDSWRITGQNQMSPKSIEWPGSGGCVGRWAVAVLAAFVRQVSARLAEVSRSADTKVYPADAMGSKGTADFVALWGSG